jgi:demethylspheroidene O-methyltransferase
VSLPASSASPKPLIHPAAPAKSWWEKWLGFRNRLIASPRFQYYAARLPLTRPIARRRARALFDLVAGFVYSQTLAACVRLKLFEMLQQGPLTIAELSRRLALGPDAAARLLKAAAALELTEALPDGRYGLGQLGAAMLGQPSLAAMIEHHAMLYADLSDPVALLRGELESPKLKAFWAYAKNADAAGTGPDQVRAYSALMAQSQAMVAREVLDACPLGRHRRLLDIGGGEGVFLLAAAARHSRLALMLFDLPAVAARAEERFRDAGMGMRATAFGGDFFRDPLPQGADIVSLVRVLHDHDDDFALAILRKAHAALPKGGTLLLAEPMAGTKGAEPAGDAYFGFYLAAMGSGRPRTAQEIKLLLHQAGFHDVRLRATATPMIVRVVTALASRRV